MYGEYIAEEVTQVLKYIEQEKHEHIRSNNNYETI